MDTLPDAFDIIVLGTGLPESIVAGAAAKAGKRVLHLDKEEHYGSQWASLPLEEFKAWSTGNTSSPICSGPVKLLQASSADLGASQQYSIDLSPKVLFCSDELIDAVLQARAHNSLEFKLLQGSYVWSSGQLVSIPASRKDVFKTQLGLADKRALWRFLKHASDALQGQGPLKEAFDDTPLVELLKTQGLSKQLRPSMQALVSAAEGKAAFARYLASVARYGQGSGAFLALMYGCGELAQAFCRVAAVHGALTALRHPVAALLVAESTGRCTGVRLATGQAIACEGVGESKAERDRDRPSSLRGVCRAVCILDGSLHREHSSLSIVIPPGSVPGPDGNPHAIRLLQSGAAMSVAPPDRYVLYASTPWTGRDAEDALRPALSAFSN
ncbi:hypothetical protein WJX73_002878 [Symbiochloris irregularis]|uniref:Rab proteins geranylgeranyltransferase component A n=1 Tax=Symbiochloris irregularis TaxID=706552 RepID=A0AAW1PR22_9CHLO